MADWGKDGSIGEILMIGGIWRRKEESSAFMAEFSAFEKQAPSRQY
jgi:hypothetical protein